MTVLTLTDELRRQMDEWKCPPLHVGDSVEVWPSPNQSENRYFGTIVAVNNKCADILAIVPDQSRMDFRVNCMFEGDPDIILKPDIFSTGVEGGNNCGIFCFTASEQQQRAIAARLPALEKMVGDMAAEMARSKARANKPQSDPQVGRPRGRPRKTVVESPDKQVNLP